MSLGIGLGAFMDGFERGTALRERIDESRRLRQNRQDLEQIDGQAKTQFDAEVAAGRQSPDKFDEFWLNWALPKRRNMLLKQGDTAGARALDEWGKSDAALKGGRLFASAMLKAQTGDAGGALEDVIKAGQVQGYIEHGYELVGREDIQDPDGNVVGYRLRVKDQDGKEMEQDIAAGDIPRMVATFANPEAAWQSQVVAREDQKKRSRDMEDFEQKEVIKQRHSKSAQPDHEKAYRDAYDARAKNDLSFGDLSPEEQDAMVRRDLGNAEDYARGRTGAPAGEGAAPAPAPGRKMIVDETTGEPVEAPVGITGAVDNRASPGLGQVQRRPLPPPESAAPPARTGSAREDLIRDAADHAVKGGNPEAIALRLRNAGIAEPEWPQELKSVLGARQQGFGLR